MSIVVPVGLLVEVKEFGFIWKMLFAPFVQKNRLGICLLFFFFFLVFLMFFSRINRIFFCVFVANKLFLVIVIFICLFPLILLSLFLFPVSITRSTSLFELLIGKTSSTMSKFLFGCFDFMALKNFTHA